MAELKKRNWAFILYPESAPIDWKDRLKLSGLLCAVSPLHDKDINPTGEPKKPHYHVLLVYSGPTTYNAVKKFTESFNATIPQALESVKGMYRYFSHKDNPEKYQYSEDNIECINGFNIADLVELTKAEVNEIKIRVLKLCAEMRFTEYSALVDYLLINEMTAEFDIAVNNTFFFNSYITSKRHAYSALSEFEEDVRERQLSHIRNQRKEEERRAAALLCTS